MLTRHLLSAVGLRADEGHGAAVTLIQLIGSAVNLNIPSDLTLRRVATERMVRVCGSCKVEGHDAEAGSCRASSSALQKSGC